MHQEKCIEWIINKKGHNRSLIDTCKKFHTKEHKIKKVKYKNFQYDAPKFNSLGEGQNHQEQDLESEWE